MEEIVYAWAHIIITNRSDGDIRSTDFSKHNMYQHTHQIHGTDILYSMQDSIDNTQQVKADGIITNTQLPIWVKIADCNGVMFVGKNHIGAIHAWWRGAAQGIIKKAITMLYEHDEIADNLYVYIWPSLRKCCMEVGADGQDFTQIFPKEYIEERGWKTYLDLISYIVDECIMSGMTAENILVYPDCTCCTGDYFSYRKGDLIERGMIGIRMHR